LSFEANFRGKAHQDLEEAAFDRRTRYDHWLKAIWRR
jgi:hypothetical protein